jgi:hypothetical protein
MLKSPSAVLLLGMLLGGGAWAEAQMIYEPYYFGTFAGRARTTWSNDGVGAAARFTLPTGIAVDPAGNIYVSGQQHHPKDHAGSSGDDACRSGRQPRKL